MKMANADLANVLRAAAYYIERGQANNMELLDAITDVNRGVSMLSQRVALDVMVSDYAAEVSHV